MLEHFSFYEGWVVSSVNQLNNNNNDDNYSNNNNNGINKNSNTLFVIFKDIQCIQCNWPLLISDYPNASNK